MSSPDAPEPISSDDLQFESAEYREPDQGPMCTACKKPIEETYFTINDAIVCPGCRETIGAFRDRGSRAGRFTRAVLFGSAASFAGFLIYFGVMKVTGYEVGLISVLVGFMVGAAVRNGSYHRGGWVYQFLAIFLSYTAIGASYAGTALPELFQKAAAKRNAEAEAKKAQANAPAEGAKAKPAPPAAEEKSKPAPASEGHKATPAGSAETAKTKPEAAADAVKAAPATPVKPEPAPEQPEKDLAKVNPAAALLILLLFLLAVVYAGPVIGNLSSPIGLLIVGFALWEAWKLNRRAPLAFGGPFELAATDSEPPAELPPGGIPSRA